MATPEQIWKDHHRLHFHQWFIPSLCDVGGRETKDGGEGEGGGVSAEVFQGNEKLSSATFSVSESMEKYATI